MSRRSIAYHEAGHVVMDDLCGRPCLYVVLPRPDHTLSYAGAAQPSFQKMGDMTRVKWEQMVLCLLAGFVAQIIHNPVFEIERSGDDVTRAMTILKTRLGYSTTASRRRFQELTVKCSRILSRPENTGRLRRVAEALDKEGFLTGSQIEELLGGP